MTERGAIIGLSARRGQILLRDHMNVLVKNSCYARSARIAASALAAIAPAILGTLARGTTMSAVATRLTVRNTATPCPVAPGLRRILAGLAAM
jgi:hypothetical protein